MNGQITRTGKNTFEVKDIYFTPCDCGKDFPPIFSIRARKAYVELGSHATFERPVLQPFDQPLPFPFALPALYIPVSKRKTGLLPPSPRSLAADGFYIEESVFITLGQTADLTAVAGWNVRRGAREKLELRYNPVAGVEGSISLSHMHDETFVNRPLLGTFNAGVFHQERFGLSANHRSGTWARASLKMNLQYFSDNTYLFDNALSLSAFATQYSASRAAFDYRGDAWRVAVGLVGYQDFTIANTATTGGSRHDSFFLPASGRTPQRVPDIGLSIAPVPLPLGLRLAVDSRAVGTVGFSNQTIQQYDVVDTSVTLQDCSQLLGDQTGTPCQKAVRAGRIDLVPRLSRPFALGPIEVKPEVFGLFAAGADAINPSVAPRGFFGARVELSTMIGRVFDTGKETKLRHRMRPILRYLLIPGIYGTVPQYKLDERDAYVPTHQLQAGFETDLYRKSGTTAGTRVLSLAVFQTANLGGLPAVAAFSFSQLGARATFAWQPVTVGLRASLDHGTGRLTEAGASFGFRDNKYVSFGADFAHFQNGGYWRMNTGLWELAPAGAIQADSQSGGLDAGSASVSVTPWRGLAVSYGVSAALVSKQVAFQQMNARIAYTGACGCFGAEVSTTFLPGFFGPLQAQNPPVINFALSIGDYTFRPN